MSFLRGLICLTFVLAVIGCGGVSEEAPPEKAPEMTAEEKANMESQIEDMKQMYQGGKKKKK